MPMHVIFVCTGNTCRSPLAEAMARQMAASLGVEVEIASAGTAAPVGAPATDGAMLVGIERGLDLSRHRSRPLLADEIPDDALLLAMSPSHVSAARAVVPGVRVVLLDEYASHGRSSRAVDDPFGGSLEDYRRAADEIASMLEGALARIREERGAGSA